MTLTEAISILELRGGDSLDEARQSHRQLAQVWHPDRFTAESLKARANAKMRDINEAFSIVTGAAVNGRIPAPVTYRETSPSVSYQPPAPRADVAPTTSSSSSSGETNIFAIIGIAVVGIAVIAVAWHVIAFVAGLGFIGHFIFRALAIGASKMK